MLQLIHLVVEIVYKVLCRGPIVYALRILCDTFIAVNDRIIAVGVARAGKCTDIFDCTIDTTLLTEEKNIRITGNSILTEGREV